MFGKKERRPTAIHTLIGENTCIEGDLLFVGGCHVDGQVNGNVKADNDPDAYLSVSENGRVQGSVAVPRLALSGTVQGDVVVSEKVELGPTARVDGNVYYNLIEMAAGAEINGQLIHKTEEVIKPVSDSPAAEQSGSELSFNTVAGQSS